MTTQSKPSLLRVIGRILLVLTGLGTAGFIAIQFVPVQRDNPPVTGEPEWDSPQTRELTRRACFDCHSNETVWPWYSYVAPVSWLVTRDVQEARAEFNSSEWRGRGKDIVSEAAELIREGEMPLPNYLSMHPQARLTAAEKQQLIEGLQVSLGQ